MSKYINIETLPLDGGCVCFNFVNTVHSRLVKDAFDCLNSYCDIIHWIIRLKLLSEKRLNELKILAQDDPNSAEKALCEIRNKRELLYKFFSMVIRRETPNKFLVDAFNKTLSNSLSQLIFTYNSRELTLKWEEGEISLNEPLKIIFKDAYDLITSLPLRRFKECKSCGWIFLDKSKNNSRKWCSMQTCGGSEKAKRYYYKKKKKIDNGYLLSR